MTDSVLAPVLPPVEQRLAQQVAERHLPGAAAGLVRGQELVTVRLWRALAVEKEPTQ